MQLSKKSSKKVLTTPNKRKAKNKILRLTFLVPISQNPSQSATCVQQLSEMLFLRKWATTLLKSITLETGVNSLVFSWLLIKSGALKKPSTPTQSMNCWNFTFASMPKSKQTRLSMMKDVSGLKNWKMAIQKQLNFGNGSVMKVWLSSTVSTNCWTLNLTA